MPRYKLTLEYDGGPYMGWQWQDHGPSVQGLGALQHLFLDRLGECALVQAVCVLVHEGGKEGADLRRAQRVRLVGVALVFPQGVLRRQEEGLSHAGQRHRSRHCQHHGVDPLDRFRVEGRSFGFDKIYVFSLFINSYAKTLTQKFAPVIEFQGSYEKGSKKTNASPQQLDHSMTCLQKRLDKTSISKRARTNFSKFTQKPSK